MHPLLNQLKWLVLVVYPHDIPMIFPSYHNKTVTDYPHELLSNDIPIITNIIACFTPSGFI